MWMGHLIKVWPNVTSFVFFIFWELKVITWKKCYLLDDVKCCDDLASADWLSSFT